MNPLTIMTRAGLLSFGLLTFSIGGSNAAPIVPAAPQAPVAAHDGGVGANALQISDRRYWRRPGGGRNWNGGGNWRGNGYWNGNRNWHGNRYWNGNRYWRPYGGYYGGYYGDFYGSGLYLGFGGPVYAEPYYYAPRYAAPRRVYRAANGHVEWCYARYRSYRASDNTFQPYVGPRRQCYSPY